MPIHEFQCLNKKCGKIYEKLVSMTDDCKGLKCPYCKSKRKEKKVSGFAFQFGNPIGTDLYNASHDYRFRHRLPSAISEREKAKKAAYKENGGYLAPEPYRKIDDISKGDKFGEVK